MDTGAKPEKLDWQTGLAYGVVACTDGKVFITHFWLYLFEQFIEARTRTHELRDLENNFLSVKVPVGNLQRLEAHRSGGDQHRTD